MSDEVWIQVADVKRIFDLDNPEREHLIVARYHGKMLADWVVLADCLGGVIRDSRQRLWQDSDELEGDLRKFTRVMAVQKLFTVYEAM
jgi:hypothetical protein